MSLDPQTMQNLANQLREQADILDRNAHTLNLENLKLSELPSDILYDFDWPLVLDDNCVINSLWRAVGHPRTERAKELQIALDNLLSAIRNTGVPYFNHPAAETLKESLSKLEGPPIIWTAGGKLGLCGNTMAWADWIKQYPKMPFKDTSAFLQKLDQEFATAAKDFQVLLEARQKIGSIDIGHLPIPLTPPNESLMRRLAIQLSQMYLS